MTATLAETAAEYSRRGIAVLALHPARKEPAGEVCPHGNDDATTDTDQVRAWWEHNPDYNIGIRPPPGYIVLDVDPRNGGGLDQLGAVPPTSIAKTGGGGWHLWFHYRGAVRGNLDGDRSSGVDIKSNSGYLVAPPSIHDVTGNRYRWISTGPIAPLPKHLVPRVAIPATTTPAARTPIDGAGNFAGLIRTAADARPGNRNNALFWAACRAVENAAAPEVLDQLLVAAIAAGQSPREAQATIRSAQRKATQ